MSRNIVITYSRRGENYVNGRIENLGLGNTEIVAGYLCADFGCDHFEIQTLEPYPEGYQQTTEQAQAELRRNARPDLLGPLPDLSGCDTVFLGYPNWWGTMPMAVFSFLEQVDLTGKTLAPFCTHEGSGLGRSEKDLHSLCPGARIVPGLALKGSRVHQAE